MDVFQRLAPRQRESLGRVVLVIWFSGLTLWVQASEAAQPPIPPGGSPAGRAPTGVHVAWGGPAEPVQEVVVGPDGVLRGRVLDLSRGFRVSKVAGRPVRLVRERQTMALTTTNYRGEFALQNLSQGQYTIVVEGSGGPSRRLCRVWTLHTAPPRARNEITVPIGDLVVRGNSPLPFPIMSLRQASVVTGIAAGAIAAPVIYHNTRIDNRVPASP